MAKPLTLLIPRHIRPQRLDISVLRIVLRMPILLVNHRLSERQRDRVPIIRRRHDRRKKEGAKIPLWLRYVANCRASASEAANTKCADKDYNPRLRIGH